MVNTSKLADILEEQREKNIGCAGWIFIILLVLALIFGLCAFGWWIEWLLWGAIAVKIFGLPALTFWQMAGLDILLSFLIPHSTGRSSSKKD